MVWPFPEGHTCRICLRVFCKVETCEEHELTAHPSSKRPLVECSVCHHKELGSAELVMHLATHLPLVCLHPRCGRLINSKADLVAHRVIDRLKIPLPGYLLMSSKKCDSTPPAVPESPNPMQKFFDCSPVGTPKRRYPDSPRFTADRILGFQRTPTLKTIRERPRTSTLTPALNNLSITLSPINDSLFESCIEEDEMMVTALDITHPMK